jgi:integrase/recombinase XerD
MQKVMKDLDLSPLDSRTFNKVTVAIIIDTRKAKKSKIKGSKPIESKSQIFDKKIRDNDYYPVKFRVTYNREQFYYPCMDLTLDEYDKLHKSVRSEKLTKTKKLIQEHFKSLTDIIDDIVVHEGFTKDTLNRRLSKGKTDSVNNAFKNKVTELQESGKVGSSVWYSCAINSIEKYADRELTFADITPSWLKGYESYLLKDRKEGAKVIKGRSYTTISMYMRALRSIINEAKANGIISQAQYPFAIKRNGGYAIPEGRGRKIALNTAQIMEVFNQKIHPDNEKWRDLWVFSFYCNGANINDILRFKYENISGNCIEWFREKTIHIDREKRKIRAIITEEMQMIIDKYGNPDRNPSNYIFPYLSAKLTPVQERKIIQNVTHNINKKMHRIGKALGYGDITTYWTRHSWASISRKEGASVFSISKGMGHKNLKTTEIYLDSLSDDELIENAAKLPRRNNNK